MELVEDLAKAFAAYESRQLTIAIRQNDIDPDQLGFNHGGDRVYAEDIPPTVLLDSLEQHPDEYLSDTVQRPDLEPSFIRRVLTEHWESQS